MPKIRLSRSTELALANSYHRLNHIFLQLGNARIALQASSQREAGGGARPRRASECPLNRRGDSGAVAVEAAFIIPLMLVFFLSVLEYSLVFFSQGAMQVGARDAARRLAVRSITITEAAPIVRAALPKWAASYATIDSYQSVASDGKTTLMTVSVTLPAHRATPIALAVSQAWNLSTTVTMRLEPAA